jgi:hypothetical protein
VKKTVPIFSGAKRERTNEQAKVRERARASGRQSAERARMRFCIYCIRTLYRVSKATLLSVL